MNYFENCKNLAEAKKIWREQCFRHHPDKGGSLELMQEINRQYANFIETNSIEYTEEQFAQDFYDLRGHFSPEKIKKMREAFISVFPEGHPIYTYIDIALAMYPGVSDIISGYADKNKKRTNEGLKSVLKDVIENQINNLLK